MPALSRFDADEKEIKKKPVRVLVSSSLKILCKRKDHQAF